MVPQEMSLEAYRAQITNALYRGLCIRDFPCQETERHNKPEVEFGTCEELLLPRVHISRQSGESCCIEPSINSCRISFNFRQGDSLDNALAHSFVRYLALKAEQLPILRRKPVGEYQISFLVTAALIREHNVPEVVRFLVDFAMEAPAFLRELKCTVNTHTRRLAAVSLAEWNES